MNEACIMLVAAGLVEIVWSQSIKPTENFTRPLPTLICIALAIVTVYLLRACESTGGHLTTAS
jgi:quaternary ammonium compound-resistance protein SugE